MAIREDWRETCKLFEVMMHDVPLSGVCWLAALKNSDEHLTVVIGTPKGIIKIPVYSTILEFRTSDITTFIGDFMTIISPVFRHCSKAQLIMIAKLFAGDHDLAAGIDRIAGITFQSNFRLAIDAATDHFAELSTFRSYWKKIAELL